VLLSPPGTGRSHLAIALSIRPCLSGQRVAFAAATEWVARLAEAKRQGGLRSELRRLGFSPLIVIDEVGDVPFEPEAVNLMFSLISARYERASVIVTSDKPGSALAGLHQPARPASGDCSGDHSRRLEIDRAKARQRKRLDGKPVTLTRRDRFAAARRFAVTSTSTTSFERPSPTHEDVR